MQRCFLTTTTTAAVLLLLLPPMTVLGWQGLAWRCHNPTTSISSSSSRRIHCPPPSLNQHHHPSFFTTTITTTPLYASSRTTTSTSAQATLEGDTPIVLRAEIAGLSREEAVAWVHAWCTQSLALSPSSDTNDPSSSTLKDTSKSSSTRPFGGQSSSTTGYAAKMQARPGLPLGLTSLPIKPTLTQTGARIVCQGLGPAFLDLEVEGSDNDEEEITQVLVRQCLGEGQLAQHSTSIRGLARDTEKTVLEKLKGDLPRTLGGRGRGREAEVVGFYVGEEALGVGVGGRTKRKVVEEGGEGDAGVGSSSGGSSSTTTVTDVDDEIQLRDKQQEEEEAKSAHFRELVESLGLAEELGLGNGAGDDEDDEGEGGRRGGKAWTGPDSPFAKKAVEAYETFVKGQAAGGGGEAAAAAAVAGMGEVLLEELTKESATPEDVKAMFEGGVRSAMQEADRVAEKGAKRKRVLAAVKEVGEKKKKEGEGLEGGLVTLQMMFEGTGLKGGVDVMSGPMGEKSVELPSLEGMKASIEMERKEKKEKKKEEAGGAYVNDDEEEEDDEDEWDEALGLLGDADPLGDIGWDVAARFDLLVRELEAAVESPDLFQSIASQYHNVFLSRHFVGLMRGKLEEVKMASEGGNIDGATTGRVQVVLSRMVAFAEQLVVQLQEMSQLYEMQQLDKIKGICQAAEEDMSKLSDYVASRKTELDEDFVKYLHYLMESEKQRLRGAGVARPEREPSNWLMILEIVKKGVYHELAKAVKDDVSMVHFITRFDEEDERDYLARAHVQRLMPSQVIPFKRVVTQMVDHFESRVNELTDVELALAGRVLQVEDILEEMHPDASLLELLQSKEGGVGLDAYKTGAETLLHDPREWDDSALAGREEELFSPEYLAAKYDRILKHYGFTASRQEGRGMGGKSDTGVSEGVEKEEEEEEKEGVGGLLSAETVAKIAALLGDGGGKMGGGKGGGDGIVGDDVAGADSIEAALLQELEEMREAAGE